MDTSTKYSPVGTKAYWLPGPAIPAEAATRKLAVGGPGYMAFTLRAVQVVVPKRLRDAFFRTSPQAVLTSSVQVDYPGLGQLEGRAIRWVQPVQRDRANRLGLQLGLVDWIPAIFPQARFSIEVTLSASNRLGPLIALTKDDDLATVLSFAPGALPAVRLLGALTDRLLSIFVTDDAQPALKFALDVRPSVAPDIFAGAVTQGDWVILSPVDAASWPQQADLSIVDGDLQIGGKPVTEFSYAIIELHRSPVRGESAGYGQPWHDQLASTRQKVTALAEQRPAATSAKKQQLWKQLQAEFWDASVLFRVDRQYTDEEKGWIVWQASQAAYHQLGLEMATPRRRRRDVAVQPLPSLPPLSAGTPGANEAARRANPLILWLETTPTPPDANPSAGDIVGLFDLPPTDTAAAINTPLVQAAEQFPTWLASAFTGREYTGDAGNIFSVVSTKTRSLTPGEGYILASGLRAYEQETHVASSTLPSLGAPLSRLHTAR